MIDSGAAGWPDARRLTSGLPEIFRWSTKCSSRNLSPRWVVS